MFTRRHYHKMAREIQQRLDKASGIHEIRYLAHTAAFLIDLFEQDNPSFSPDRFIDACKGDDEGFIKMTEEKRSVH